MTIPLAVGTVWLGVVLGLKPLEMLSQSIVRQDPRLLTPIAEQDVPGEVRPLVRALNYLMRRMEQTLRVEKQFTDHAAHELRTPLAALKTQSQVALRTQDPIVRSTVLVDLLSGVDRASHMVSQLLLLARTQSGDIALETVAPAEPIRKVVAELTGAMRAKRIKMQISLDDRLRIRGNGHLLEILTRNVIDNAVKYSYENGTIGIVFAAREGGAVLSVLDSGPGISEVEMEKVFQRFYRVPGTRQSGSGLGLALVRTIAELHKARIEVSSVFEGRGVRFQVVFPL